MILVEHSSLWSFIFLKKIFYQTPLRKFERRASWERMSSSSSSSLRRLATVALRTSGGAAAAAAAAASAAAAPATSIRCYRFRDIIINKNNNAIRTLSSSSSSSSSSSCSNFISTAARSSHRTNEGEKEAKNKVGSAADIGRSPFGAVAGDHHRNHHGAGRRRGISTTASSGVVDHQFLQRPFAQKRRLFSSFFEVDKKNEEEKEKKSGRQNISSSLKRSTTTAPSSSLQQLQQQQKRLNSSDAHASDASSQGERKPPGVSTLDKNIVDNVLNTRHVQSLRERLDEMKYTKEFITIEKFGELCEECGCTDKKPEEYVEIMKNAGMVIQIEDYVYLEPQNITRAVINALPGVPARIYGVSDSELKRLNEEYDQMREKVILAERKAARRANQLLYGGFIVLIAQLAVFVRFTYVEFSWDVMEPISYFVGLVNVIMGYMYFMYTQRDFSFGTWQNQMMQSAMDRQLKTGKFDVTKYEQMARKLRRRNMIR
jgi:hypothetical protein